MGLYLNTLSPIIIASKVVNTNKTCVQTTKHVNHCNLNLTENKCLAAKLHSLGLGLALMAAYLQTLGLGFVYKINGLNVSANPGLA